MDCAPAPRRRRRSDRVAAGAVKTYRVTGAAIVLAMILYALLGLVGAL